MKAQSQRQLRAGELIRRALSEVLAEGHLREPALQGVSITVTEARAAPDLRQATVFIAALGREDEPEIAEALNRASGFLQKELARRIDLKFTPKLRFLADDRFEEAAHVEAMLARPGVKRDLD